MDNEDRLEERWRKPPEILGVKDDHTHVDGATGFVRYDFLATLSPDTIERVRTGYICLRCLEPQREPFPEECAASWCSYRIHDSQPEDFAREHKGQARVGPSTDISEELDRLDDTHERRIFVPGTQILVPRSVKISGRSVRATGRLHTTKG